MVHKTSVFKGVGARVCCGSIAPPRCPALVVVVVARTYRIHNTFIMRWCCKYAHWIKMRLQ